MKSVAYIITQKWPDELVQECLLPSIAQGTHGAKVVAMYFAEDGVYHLLKANPDARKIIMAIEDEDIKIIVSKQSVRQRKLDHLLLEGVTQGDFSDFYQAAQDADHIISF
ncbi:MAG: DsrE family protein [candidate division KSB1 bacterium]|nr:DsrE family protein [candidate division KSB1 bacterium]